MLSDNTTVASKEMGVLKTMTTTMKKKKKKAEGIAVVNKAKVRE